MTTFEKAADQVDSEFGTGDGGRECVIEYVKGSPVATVGYPKGRMATKIRRLAERFPDQVEIVAGLTDDDNGGYLVAHIPVSAIHISIRKGRKLTEEQKEAARQRLLDWHRRRAEGLETGDLDEEDFSDDSDDDDDDVEDEVE